MIPIMRTPLLCLSLLLVFSPMAWADSSAPAPKRFMPLDAVRAGKAAIRTGDTVAVLQANGDLHALPSGFMPLNRAMLAPVPRQSAINLGAAGSVHMVEKPKEKAVILEESSEEDSDETSMHILSNTEREVASVPVFRDVVRHINRAARHAWPLPRQAEQRFSSAFGMRRDPFTQQTQFHEGIDIATATGTAVLASADGIVSAVARGQQFGKYVRVKHRDGSLTTYGHLSAQSVHEGQRVMQGQKLGEVGSTGRSTAAHLHFQLDQRGKPVNPLAALTPPWKARMGLADSHQRIVQ